MSGIEIAGLVLGAFPLIISSLEHYESTKKYTITWWRIRRAHRRDLGRVKNCEVQYKLHMTELLIPLRLEGVISEQEFEDLLADSRGNGWQRSEVQEALHHRLADARDRYLAVLQELDEAITRLAKATFVDDVSFQAKLQATNDVQQKENTDLYANGLVHRANAHFMFEVKRMAYTLTMHRRDALLDEIETHNKTLSRFLKTCDRIAAHEDTRGQPNMRRVRARFKAALSFCQYADHIHQLLNEAWKCPCRHMHCAFVWLQQPSTEQSINLDILLRGSKNQWQSSWEQLLRVALKDDDVEEEVPRTAQLANSQPSKGVKRLRFEDSRSVEGLEKNKARRKNTDFSVSSELAQIALTASRFIFTSGSPSKTGTSLLPNAKDHGLCALAREATADSAALWILKNASLAQTYELRLVPEAHPLRGDQSFNLDTLLQGGSGKSLPRVERLILAYSVAYSFLQFFQTPWLPSRCTAKDIHLPTSIGTSQILYRKAYFESSFCRNSIRPAVPDVAFSELGIVLLELCFGHPLESHPSWMQLSDGLGPTATGLLVPGPGDLIRKATACDWVRDVALDAGEKYSHAVEWCLNRATLKSNTWRLDFAQNVLYPLHTCYSAAMEASGQSV
ncbi:hypothetical protein CKM354_000897400 [Cercospora kikuchii]|uniref:DUF7580 domain-containing protein n=1 Tax=Cercospora kikuchii TaxID=84275 RepID=A0A9P3CWU0_9PEZI|nr:uncharacterized protein CKM354_000897400 [Cercospora kikuchii]GIZ45823.1 hypothetical protein CKM354_000897400 [Cercospora kikuchii]